MLASAALALGLVLLAPDARPAPEDLRALGDAAWDARGDPARLVAALDAYRRLAAEQPGEPAVELRLARAEAFRALENPAEASDAWIRASRAAERALRRLSPRWAAAVDAGEPVEAAAQVDESGAEALYWLALAAWSGAQAKGFSAILAVKDVALASMERAAELDGTTDCAGPHRALGAWKAALPAAVGGGADRARIHFEKALSLGPRCRLTRLREAETLFVLLQDKKEFESALEEVLSSADADPRWAPEDAIARRMARELLTREPRLF
jgi:hypothetical protein